MPLDCISDIFALDLTPTFERAPLANVKNDSLHLCVARLSQCILKAFQCCPRAFVGPEELRQQLIYLSWGGLVEPQHVVESAPDRRIKGLLEVGRSDDE